MLETAGYSKSVGTYQPDYIWFRIPSLRKSSIRFRTFR